MSPTRSPPGGTVIVFSVGEMLPYVRTFVERHPVQRMETMRRERRGFMGWGYFDLTKLNSWTSSPANTFK